MGTADVVDAPAESLCPECGTPPPDEQVDRAIAYERLTNTGYLHADFDFECAECGAEWTCGKPVGDFEGGDDLWCDSCDDGYMLVHRVVCGVQSWVPDDGVGIHLKCPRPECHHFRKVTREADHTGVVLVGYPPITGEVTEDTRPYGWADEPP